MLFKKISFIVFLMFFVFINKAQAYIDPGSGSYLFQILVSGLIGFLFFAKTIIRQINTFLDVKILKRKKNDDGKES